MAVTELTNWGAVGMQSGIKSDLALHEMNKRDVESRANNLTNMINQALAVGDYNALNRYENQYNGVAFNPDVFEKRIVYDDNGNMFTTPVVKTGSPNTWTNNPEGYTYVDVNNPNRLPKKKLPWGVGTLPPPNPMGLHPGAGVVAGIGNVGSTPPPPTYSGVGPAVSGYNLITSKLQPNMPGLANPYKPSPPPQTYFKR